MTAETVSRAQSHAPLTARGNLWPRLQVQTLRPHPLHWLKSLHCVPAAGRTCGASSICDVEPGHDASRRQGDIGSAPLLPVRLNESRRSLALLAHCSSTASGLVDDGIPRPAKHALEMKYGAAAGSALSYWAAYVPRGSHVREFAPYLIHLSIAIAIHLHTRLTGLARTRTFLLGIVSYWTTEKFYSIASRHRSIHSSCPTARPHRWP